MWYNHLRDDEDEYRRDVSSLIRHIGYDEAEQCIDDDGEASRRCCDEDRWHKHCDKVCDADKCHRYTESSDDLDEHEHVDASMQDVGMTERVCESAQWIVGIERRNDIVERCDGDKQDDGCCHIAAYETRR